MGKTVRTHLQERGQWNGMFIAREVVGLSARDAYLT